MNHFGRTERKGLQLFVDYWNFMNTLRDEAQARGRRRAVDWPGFTEWLAEQASRLLDMDDVEFARVHFFTAYNPDTTRGRNQQAFFRNLRQLDKRYQVWMNKQSRETNPPKCPQCREEIGVCTNCGADMRGYEEKGVDVALAVRMMREMHEGRLGAAVLISSDRDFIPLIREIRGYGVTTLHAGFPSGGRSVRDRCDKAIDVSRALRYLMERS